MTDLPNAQDRMRSILTMVATLATVVFNAIAGAGYVNDVSPAVVSDRYPTVITPAGYAFSIWSLIYVGLIAFSVYQLLPRNLVRFRRVRSLYVISCALNCAWIYSWHHDQIGYCLGIIAALLFVLIAMLAQFEPETSGIGKVVTRGVFGIYAGWVTAATLVNGAIFLRSEDIQLSIFAWSTLGVTALSIALIAGVAARITLRNFTFPLAIAWAATAIAVKQSGNTAIVVAAAICVIVSLVMAISFVMDKQGTETL